MRTIALMAGIVAGLSAPTFAAAQQAERCDVELNYDEADIRAVIEDMAVRTGRTFLLDPRVQGRVTVKSPPNGGICPDEAWELFQAMLRVNGFAATPLGARKYRIVPVQEGPRSAGPVGEAASGDLVTRIVRLRYIDAREAASNLAQLVNERGVVAPVRTGNAVIIVDTADNAERLREVLTQIDRDPTVYRTIPLSNASASDIARVVSSLAQEMASEGGGQASSVSVVPVEASNSLLVRAEPGMLDRIGNLVAELDRMGASRPGLAVVFLDHADAEELAPLLQELASAQAPVGAGESGGRRTTIAFHKPTNSILINGDADMQRTMQGVIAQLDTRRAQVQIEAIIVEISDRTARELGLQYFLTGTEGSAVPFSLSNFSRGPNMFGLAGATMLETGNLPGAISEDFAQELAETAIQSLLGMNGFMLGGGGQIGGGTVFNAVLTAIREDESSNVLSTPSVVTLDNQEARLTVGQEIPITTGEAIGANLENAFRTISRVEVGVILTVTPTINEGGTVTMRIQQETSNVAGQIISSSTDLITNKREVTTTALVDDGEILVIGGLIDQQRRNREDKIPLLGDIPIAGNLFKQTARSSERTNLMVFIRPTILRDKETARSATKKKMDYLRAREMLHTGQPESALDRLIEQVTGTAEPGAQGERP